MYSFSAGIGGWKYQEGVTSFELCALSLVWSGIDSANEGCTVCKWHQRPGLGVLLPAGAGAVGLALCAEMWAVTPYQCPSSTDPCSFGELPGSWVFPALLGFFSAEIQKLLNTCLSSLCHYNLNCWYKLHL